MSGGEGLVRGEALAAWIARQRWFAAKTRRIQAVVVLDTIRLGPGAVVLAELELDDGRHDRYAIPLLPGDEIRDALSDADFCRALLSLLARGGAVAGERGTVVGMP